MKTPLILLVTGSLLLAADNSVDLSDLPPPGAGSTQVGRYQLHSGVADTDLGRQSAILRIDTATGETWVLTHAKTSGGTYGTNVYAPEMHGWNTVYESPIRVAMGHANMLRKAFEPKPAPPAVDPFLKSVTTPPFKE